MFETHPARSARWPAPATDTPRGAHQLRGREVVVHLLGALVLACAILSIPEARELFQVVRSPAAVVTSLFLAGQCWLLATRASRVGTRLPSERRRWRTFFVFVGWSAAIGAAKHGITGLVPETVYTSVTAASNLALGGGILSIQYVLIEGWRRTIAMWGVVFVAVAGYAAVTASFRATAVAAAVGMLPVVFTTVRQAGSRRPGSRHLSAAWATAAFAGLAWVAAPVPTDWFDRIDVAHVILAPALLLIFLGAVERMNGGPRSDWGPESPLVNLRPTGTVRSES